MDSQVQDIKDKINISDLVGQYVKLDRAGRNMRARCPFHKEKTASFFISPERGTYICFGCGEKGDIFSFIQRMDGLDFPQALIQLAQRAGISLHAQKFSSISDKNNNDRIYAVCEEATNYFQNILKSNTNVLNYLKERGLKDETITFWKLGYAPPQWETLSQHLLAKGFTKKELIDAGVVVRSEKKEDDIYDRFRGRVMFPISDINGRVIAFSGRLFEDVHGLQQENASAKYVNSPETAVFKKSKILYGLNQAKQAIRRIDCILLVEGQFDLVLSHQSGLAFAVALSGTSLTSDHLSMLGRLSKRLVIALDADPAGLRSGIKSTHLALKEGFDVKIPLFPNSKDPADIASESPDTFRDIIRKSKSAIEFFLEALRSSAHDERGYKKIVELQILPLVASIGSKIDQSHFISIISQRLGVPENAVLEEVVKLSSSLSPTQEFSLPQNNNNIIQSVSGSMERAAALILFYYPEESAEVTRVKALLGQDRVSTIYSLFKDEAEILRFEFESLGIDSSEINEGILETIERCTIEESLHNLQLQLRKLDDKESTDETELLRMISSLKKRQEELRN